MALTEEQISDLVTAMLAVNQYPLDKASGLMPAFKERGLLQPAAVLAMQQEHLIEALKAAGYDRGGYLPILSYRMYPLMEAISTGELDALPAFAARGEEMAFQNALTRLHGFGPKVAATAWMLWTSAQR